MWLYCCRSDKFHPICNRYQWAGNLRCQVQKRSHTNTWEGRMEERTWILGGIGLSPGCSFLMLPCGIQAVLFSVAEGAEEGLIGLLFKWHPWIMGNFGLMEIGPFLPTPVWPPNTWPWWRRPPPTHLLQDHPFVVPTVVLICDGGEPASPLERGVGG